MAVLKYYQPYLIHIIDNLSNNHTKANNEFQQIYRHLVLVCKVLKGKRQISKPYEQALQTSPVTCHVFSRLLIKTT